MKIDVDEGFGYDVLAIAEVKTLCNPNNNVALASWLKRLSAYSDEIGNNLHLQVVRSEEYQKLLIVNLDLYFLIEKNKILKRIGLAVVDPDPLNYERFICKTKLREKFFPEKCSDFAEQKFGYESK